MTKKKTPILIKKAENFIKKCKPVSKKYKLGGFEHKDIQDEDIKKCLKCGLDINYLVLHVNGLQGIAELATTPVRFFKYGSVFCCPRHIDQLYINNVRLLKINFNFIFSLNATIF